MNTPRRYYPSPITVLAIDSDGGKMDCCDDDPRHIWVVTAWSHRRAVKTHAAPFLKAANTEDLYSLEGRMFLARIDLDNPPPFDHEGGERLEWPELTVAPSMDEVRADLGLPARPSVAHKAEFEPDFASASLRSFLGILRQFTAEESTQVVIETPDLWWRVCGAEYDGYEVKLTVKEQAFTRGPLCACPDEHDEKCEQQFIEADADFEPHYSLADALCTAEEEGLDIAFTEDWPAGKFLRYDEDEQRLMIHGDGEVRPYEPTYDEAVLYAWRIIEQD